MILTDERRADGGSSWIRPCPDDDCWGRDYSRWRHYRQGRRPAAAHPGAGADPAAATPGAGRPTAAGAVVVTAADAAADCR
jgi:hypothetical protein